MCVRCGQRTQFERAKAPMSPDMTTKQAMGHLEEYERVALGHIYQAIETLAEMVMERGEGLGFYDCMDYVMHELRDETLRRQRGRANGS